MSDSDAELTPINKNGSYRQQYQSNRRPITQDEIKNALHLAQEASSDETFLVVMRPTHVYKRFFVVNVICPKLRLFCEFFQYVNNVDSVYMWHTLILPVNQFSWSLKNLFFMCN